MEKRQTPNSQFKERENQIALVVVQSAELAGASQHTATVVCLTIYKIELVFHVHGDVSEDVFDDFLYVFGHFV